MLLFCVTALFCESTIKIDLIGSDYYILYIKILWLGFSKDMFRFYVGTVNDSAHN